MKITRIYIKNLNSLRGEFTIDLEQQPFADAGIFAITGPTGAGKSTILDAITLALYGRAARYDNKPNPESMMSRGTGECQAEVEFEVSKGRYRASWQMKRARGKADGKLQPVSRFVYKIGHDFEEVPIAQNVTEANSAVAELTGLDVDRFFRSVLLAQGDFVKFLKATADERASLLESLTGTSIYSEISKRAHEETSKRGHALKLREKDLEAIALLKDEERVLFLQQAADYKRDIQKSTLRLKELEQLIVQGNTLEKYLQQQSMLSQQLAAIKQERLRLEVDSKRLELFKAGAPFFIELRALDQLLENTRLKKINFEHAQKKNLTAKNELRVGLDVTLEMVLTQIDRFEKLVSDSLIARKQKCEKFESLEVWLEMHRRDQTLDVNLSRIVEGLTSLLHHRVRLKEADSRQNSLHRDLKAVQQRLKSLQREKEEALNFFQSKKIELDGAQQAHAKILNGKTVEDINQDILALERHAAFLIQKHDYSELLKRDRIEIKDLQASVDEQGIKCAEARHKTSSAEASLKEEHEKVQQLKKAHDEGRLIASFHDHRKQLLAGKSCPLCGSLDHPFVATADGVLPKATQLENELDRLTSNLSKKDSELKKLISMAARLEENLKNSSEALAKVSFKAESTQKTLDELLQADGSSAYSYLEKASDSQKEKEACAERLLSLRTLVGQIQQSENGKHVLQKAVDSAKHAFELANSKIASQEENIQSLVEQSSVVQNELHGEQVKTSELEISLLAYLDLYELAIPSPGEEKKLSEKLEKRKRAYQENLKLSGDLKNELGALAGATREQELECAKLKTQKGSLDQLLVVYGVQHLESHPKQRIAFASQLNTLEEAYEGIERLKTSLNISQSVLEGCKKDWAKAQDQHAGLEKQLSLALSETPFQTTAKLRDASLDFSEVQRIQKNEEDVKARFDISQGQLSLVQGELEGLVKGDAPRGDRLREIQAQHVEMSKQTNEAHGLAAVCENKLLQDEKNHLRHAQQHQAIEIDRRQLFIWQKLSGLIGSHDGKAFRKFAQGLSLDLLIKHANLHLRLLNNRYRLKRVAGEELDLEIQDLHQANATRPTASLSGGESFLTSLALALGLSDLAGKNVKIDSLFIDEGFGSLDSETLEVAVQALESLRSKNKTIGVISHIDLLKERIPTQIVIEKGAGGISSMSFSS